MQFPDIIEDKIKSYLLNRGWRINIGDCFNMKNGFIKIDNVRYRKNETVLIHGYRHIIYKDNSKKNEICGFQIIEKIPSKYTDFKFIDRDIILTKDSLIS